MEGCYSIAVNDSKKFGNFIVRTSLGLQYKKYLQLHESGKWNPITFSTFNCSHFCNAMFTCKELFCDNQQSTFSALLTVQNIFILGIFIVIATLLIITVLIAILKN